MKYTFRSKFLIFIGKYIYGEPKAFGVDCSADEFYALENERVKANTALHPATAGYWQNMKSQLYKNEMRLTVFKHVSYISVILAVSVITVGNVANKSFVYIGDKVAIVKSNYQAEQKSKAQLDALVKDLTKQQKNDIESWNANHDTKDFATRFFNFVVSLDNKVQIATQLLDGKNISHGTFVDGIESLSKLTIEYNSIKKANKLEFDQTQVDQFNEMVVRIEKAKKL